MLQACVRHCKFRPQQGIRTGAGFASDLDKLARDSEEITPGQTAFPKELWNPKHRWEKQVDPLGQKHLNKHKSWKIFMPEETAASLKSKLNSPVLTWVQLYVYLSRGNSLRCWKTGITLPIVLSWFSSSFSLSICIEATLSLFYHCIFKQNPMLYLGGAMLKSHSSQSDCVHLVMSSLLICWRNLVCLVYGSILKSPHSKGALYSSILWTSQWERTPVVSWHRSVPKKLIWATTCSKGTKRSKEENLYSHRGQKKIVSHWSRVAGLATYHSINHPCQNLGH